MNAPRPPAVSGAEIIEVALPLRRPYRSGTTSLGERRLLLVRLFSDGLEGWGECGPVPGYSPETLDECMAWLTLELGGGFDREPPDGPGPATARFAVSAAAADLRARRAGLSLGRYLGATKEHIEIGAVIGLGPAVEDLPGLAERLAAEGYRRIKLKIDADRGPERIAAVRKALPDYDLAADANGTLDPADLASAARFDEYGLSFIEQPFPPGALAAHAALARQISTLVCLDESIDGAAAAARVIEAGAAGIINIKPARVGGIEEAVAVHDLAAAAGLAAWCGGMLESGIGKAAALAVAGLPGMTMAADLPPSSRHFENDLINPAWEMQDGCMALPKRPGSGISPDCEAIDRVTVATTRFGEDVVWRP